MSEQVRVSVIMPFLNMERFIEEAIESVRAQTYPSWELLLVDDGSTDGSTALARQYAERYPKRIRYLEHEGHVNRGASATRNRGIQHARGEYLALLDADDVWLPQKLEQQVPLLDSRPEAGSLYSNTLFWYSWSGNGNGSADYLPRLGVPPYTLLTPPALLTRILEGRAAVPCTCALLMRRSVVEQIGGFEESFRIVFTDQAFYTKLFLAAPVFVTDGYWDKYRRHEDSSCSVVEEAGMLEQKRLAYLRWFAGYLTERKMDQGELWDALQKEIWWQERRRLHDLREASRRLRARVKEEVGNAVRRALPASVHGRIWRRFPGWRQATGGLDFGKLHRVTPVSRHFGFDRGQPVDRYYIERFLARRADDIRGRVLEVGDDSYTRRFGGSQVSVRDVLHVTEGNPQATIVADLTQADHVPSDAFDCLILTQTLHLLYAMPAAVRTIHRILKPGGVCLATVPGISQLEEGEWRDTWYWSLTERSARRLFEEEFGAGAVEVASHGNVLAACAFLQGLASEELRPEELDYRDPSYPVLITIRAVKAAGHSGEDGS
ncbi:hypothetical protein BH23GEM7_BH23GEM7_03570 [soil metagenome]